jgi:hypothetical protein
MKISDDKLKIFNLEGDLVQYLKVNGNSGAAINEAVNRWKSINSSSSKVEKTTIVVTETDSTVETK